MCIHLKAAKLNVIPPKVINLSASFHFFMKFNCFWVLEIIDFLWSHFPVINYPCGIKCDNKFAWLECVHNFGDQIHVVPSGNVGLKAHITELRLWCDVNGSVISHSTFIFLLTLKIKFVFMLSLLHIQWVSYVLLSWRWHSWNIHRARIGSRRLSCQAQVWIFQTSVITIQWWN